MSKTQLALNSEELKDFILYHIKNNKILVDKGQLPLAISIIGEGGCGKTSTIMEVAEMVDMDFFKFSPQQCSEVSDIQGYPNRQFKMCHPEYEIKTVFVKDENGSTIKKTVKEKFNGDTCVWVDEQFVKEWVAKGYTNSGIGRESYLPPYWVADRSKPMILLIDDYTRCQKRHLQALMELILTQGYIGWSLPKGSIVLLTENEFDSGKYDVNEIDPAMRTRFITIPMKFDIHCWAKWAESAQIDTRAINFLLMHPEIMSIDPSMINARSMTQFFNSLNAIDDMGNIENIKLIRQNGISIGPDVSEMFITFISQGLDKLPSPQEIFENKKTNEDGSLKIITDLVDLINEKDRYRADIATVIATRLINYSIYRANEGKFDKSCMERFKLIITNENIFKPDVRMRVCKATLSGNNKFKQLIVDPVIQQAMFPNLK